MSRNALTVVAICVIAATVAAQQASPVFEVASVKQNTSSQSFQSFRWEPTGIRVSNMPLDSLLIFAFLVGPEQLVNLPGWARSERYDITASLSDALKRPDLERRTAVQNLLRDRFKLVVRQTSQDADAFSLVKVGTTLGPSMRIAETKCDRESITARGGDSTQCRFTNDRAKGLLTGHMTVNDLVNVLRSVVSQPVIDRTGLADEYEITLRWAPEAGGVAVEALDGASIYTAVQEQLGLRLVAGKAPANAYIIESIERPTPD